MAERGCPCRYVQTSQSRLRRDSSPFIRRAFRRPMVAPYVAYFSVMKIGKVTIPPSRLRRATSLHKGGFPPRRGFSQSAQGADSPYIINMTGILQIRHVKIQILLRPGLSAQTLPFASMHIHLFCNFRKNATKFSDIFATHFVIIYKFQVPPEIFSTLSEKAYFLAFLPRRCKI